MAEPTSNIPTPILEPLPPTVYLPPIVRDPVPVVVPVAPVLPIENSYLPEPRVLAELAKPVPRQIALTAAKRGDPEPYAFGHCIVDGSIIAADDDGDWLVLDILWSVGQIDYFEGLFVDRVFEGRADQLGNMQHFEGTTGQAVSSIMDALKGSNYDTLTSKAHSVLRWRGDYETLNIQGWVRGLKLFDPRLSPQAYVYSKNPALALARVLVDCGYTMNWTSVGAAADYCDELIGSPNVKRWEIGGQITKRASASEWIKALTVYANCFIDLIGSEVYLIPDKPRASNHTVTADDMILESIRIGRAGGRDVPSAVTVYGQSFDADTATVGVDGLNYTSGPISHTYGTQDGAGTVSEIRLPWLQSVHACGRMAEQIYRKAHKDMTLEFVGFDDGLQRTIGDVGSITNAAFGLSAQLMTLIENEQIDRGRWRRKYVQYDAANYSDVIYTSTENGTLVQNPNQPPSGPTPTVEEIVDIDLADNQFSRLKVTFTGQSYPYLKEYRVRVSSTLAGDFDPVILDQRVPNTSASSYSVFTDSARYGTEYTAEVFIVSNVNAEGDAGSATAVPVLQPDPTILWDSTPIYASRIVPAATSFLDLYFAPYDTTYGDKTGCEFYYHHHMLTMVPVISQAFVAGEYVVKWEPVETLEGSALVAIDSTSSADGVWYDLYDQIIELNDTASESPQTAQHQIIDVTVARDDGAGAPVEGTNRTKRITFYSFRAPDGYLVEDQFTGTNGTALTSHTPNTDTVGGGWANHSGTFQIQGNNLQANSANSRAVIDSGQYNVSITGEVEYGNEASSPITSSNLGLIGRAQDSSNYWLLLVDSAATANPVLKLILYTAGVASIKAQKTMTGTGPLGDSLFQAIRLSFSGNDIVGTVTINDPWYVHEVRYTSSSLNTETHHGIFSAVASIPDNWVKFYIAKTY